MAETLTRDVAVALLSNTLATGAVLVVLISIFAPISGAHFNPAVSFVFALRGDLTPLHAAYYATAQIVGALFGAVLAHLMFGLPLLAASLKVRTGAPIWLAEAVATFGLIMVICAGLRFQRHAIPWLVGLYIVAAYWFTSSTSFANPAVAIARSLSNTFAGVRPVDLLGFVPAELIGALRTLRNSGETLLAIYHSHPRGPAQPSQRDLERAFYPDAAHVIVSLATSENPAVRGFRIVDAEAIEIELRAIV
jgi:glycerol uptake facilitator-like aquaporin